MHICQPLATCFNPQPCFLTIRPCLSTPSHMFSTSINLFWHPRSQKTCTSNCTCVCFLYLFFFGFENACMSNCTHVSYLFSFFFLLFPSEHVYKQLYTCFLFVFFFFSFSSPRNMCMSNCTHVSYLFFFFSSFPLGARVRGIVHVFLGFILFFFFCCFFFVLVVSFPFLFSFSFFS
jgi:hypothetical protein